MSVAMMVIKCVEFFHDSLMAKGAWPVLVSWSVSRFKSSPALTQCEPGHPPALSGPGSVRPGQGSTTSWLSSHCVLYPGHPEDSLGARAPLRVGQGARIGALRGEDSVVIPLLCLPPSPLLGSVPGVGTHPGQRGQAEGQIGRWPRLVPLSHLKRGPGLLGEFLRLTESGRSPPRRLPWER